MQKKQLEKLRKIFSDDLLIDEESLVAYSYDAAQTEVVPEAVVFAKNTEQVSQLLKFANEEKISITPRGAGTGLSGGSVPINKGVVLCMDRMKKIISFDPENRLITVEAGMVTSEIDKYVRQKKLFYPPDPGSVAFSTIGGNVAENAGGLRGLKYGVTKDYVKALKTVLPSGEIVVLGASTVKNVAGFNLEGLMIGSEGALGIFTEVTLRLLPLPEAIETVLAVFSDIDNAARSVAAILAQGITPSTLEIMDQVVIRAIEAFKPCGFPVDAEAILVIETDGYRESAQREMLEIERILRSNHVHKIERSKSDIERETILEGRRVALSALARLKPTTLLEDITVHCSDVPVAMKRIRKIAEKHEIAIGTFGHVGDGNLHPTLLFDKQDSEELKRAQRAAEDIFSLAIELGGSISGEHGIGTEKLPFLKKQIGDGSFEVMKLIKKTLDPLGILNIGKVVNWD